MSYGLTKDEKRRMKDDFRSEMKQVKHKAKEEKTTKTRGGGAPTSPVAANRSNVLSLAVLLNFDKNCSQKSEVRRSFFSQSRYFPLSRPFRLFHPIQSLSFVCFSSKHASIDLASREFSNCSRFLVWFDTYATIYSYAF
jgi:hypothetical protein